MNRKFKKVTAALCGVTMSVAVGNKFINNNNMVRAAGDEIDKDIANLLKSILKGGISLETAIELESCSIKYSKDPNSIAKFKFTHLGGNVIDNIEKYEILKDNYLNHGDYDATIAFEKLEKSNEYMKAGEVGRKNLKLAYAIAYATINLLNPISRLNVIKQGYAFLVAGLASLIPGILAAIAGIKGIGIAMETLRARQMDKINEQRRKKAQESYDKMRKDLYSSSSIDYSKDWKDIAKEFDKLKEKSPHNAKPISGIVALLRGYFASCKEDPTKKCLVLSMYGTPGCGKSSFCEDMAKILGASDPVKISYADFDPADKELSVRKQVSGKWHVGDQERGYFAYGKLVSALKHNKHPFIILDELDKLPKEVISLLWDAVDTGRINIDGEDINCEGAIFVLPTNQPLSDIKLGGDADDENMASKALNDRVRIFKFNKPSEKDYKAAVTKLLVRIATSTQKNYKLELKYDENIINYIAKKCVENDFGMRSIPLFDALIRGAIQEKYDKECEATGAPSVQSIKLGIDDINGSEKVEEN